MVILTVEIVIEAVEGLWGRMVLPVGTRLVMNHGLFEVPGYPFGLEILPDQYKTIDSAGHMVEPLPYGTLNAEDRHGPSRAR